METSKTFSDKLMYRIDARVISCRENEGPSERQQGFLEGVEMMREHINNEMMREHINNSICVLLQVEEREQENPPEVEAHIQRQENEVD